MINHSTKALLAVLASIYFGIVVALYLIPDRGIFIAAGLITIIFVIAVVSRKYRPVCAVALVPMAAAFAVAAAGFRNAVSAIAFWYILILVSDVMLRFKAPKIGKIPIPLVIIPAVIFIAIISGEFSGYGYYLLNRSGFILGNFTFWPVFLITAVMVLAEELWFRRVTAETVAAADNRVSAWLFTSFVASVPFIAVGIPGMAVVFGFNLIITGMYLVTRDLAPALVMNLTSKLIFFYMLGAFTLK